MEVDEQQNSPTSKCNKRGKSKGKKICLPYTAEINSNFQSEEFKSLLKQNFEDRIEMKHESGCHMYAEPFKTCVLPNFIKDQRFLEGLRDELADQIFHEKNNDLYQFQQSDDLKKMSSPHIKTLRKMFHEEVRDWMQEVSGISLSSKIAMTCSKYEYTDVLLCHDDELETRRIAFILYLVPAWRTEDGGALQLFDMDEHLQPNGIVRSLLPAWNTLTWFEVTEASHHQVAEVLCPDKTRLSVNGWFHGETILRPERYVEPTLPLCPYIPLEEEQFYDWINPIYLDPDVQGQIQEKFEADSEIELQEFLKEEKYTAVMKAFAEEEICWCQAKPPNKRNYSCAEESNLPSILKQCLQFLCSEPMFLTLSNLTGLGLHELAPADSDSDHSTVVADSQDRERCIDTIDEENEELSESECSNRNSDKVSHCKRRKLNSDCVTTEQGARKHAESDKCRQPRCCAELRKWQHGNYTLLHDTDTHNKEFALDAMLFCACKDWQTNYGGCTTYLARAEDEELLTVVPAENSLALVYRDKDTLRFVKHINKRMQDETAIEQFYDFSVVYYE